MSLYSRVAPMGANGLGYATEAEQVVADLDLAGRTVLLTGCNSGLGAETMRVLCGRGATVLGAARTLDKADAACAPYGDNAIGLACELSEPESVRAAVEVATQHGPLDAIIANAGIMALPDRQVKHGLELQFLTNHIGHFILVTGLLERLTPSGRVVMLSSEAHKGTYKEGVRFDDLAADNGYTAWGAYGQAKVSNLLFSNHLATRLPGGQTSNAVHPGVIRTNLGRHMGLAAPLWWLAEQLVLKTIPQGAATQTFVAVHPDAAGVSGEYWSHCNLLEPSDHGRDAGLAAKLWEHTEALVADL